MLLSPSTQSPAAESNVFLPSVSVSDPCYFDWIFKILIRLL